MDVDMKGCSEPVVEFSTEASDSSCFSTMQLGHVALCYAAVGGEVPQLLTLLEGKANPNLCDYEGRSPLHLAANRGQLEAVRVLLEHRGDPNICDNSGATVLDEAGGKTEIMALLTEHGALGKGMLKDTWAVKSMRDVKLGKKLSETLKSQVFMASWMGTPIVAKVAKESEDADLQQELRHEISMMAKMRHPDLVAFLGAQLQDPRVLFVEYMPGGDLQTYYDRKKANNGGYYVASRRQVVKWSSAVVRALSFLHGNHIIHRDLKPLNLLMSKDHREVKVADFGISKVAPKTNCHTRMSGGVGSWRYMAPEVLRYEHYDTKADIFAFGLILFFMSSGREPFHERPKPDWMLLEYQKGREPRPDPAQGQAGLREIMAAAWHAKPALRPPALELVARLAELPEPSQSCAFCPVS